MNCIDKFVICLAGGMMATAGLHAADGTPSGNPYAMVVERNVFALNPPTIVTPAPPEPPVKITPNGIMSIFGHLQVLFKAAGPALPGKPGGEQSYILMEGQRQDDIEVTKINEKAGIVTFNNHGEIQELPLVKASASTTSMPALTPSVQNFGGNTGGGFGSRFGGPRNIGGRPGMSNNGNNSLNPGAGPMRNSNLLAAQQTGMTPEEQTVGIEANRMLIQDQVNRGELPPLPPTEITPPDATGIGGTPLVAPPQ